MENFGLLIFLQIFKRPAAVESSKILFIAPDIQQLLKIILSSHTECVKIFKLLKTSHPLLLHYRLCPYGLTPELCQPLNRADVDGWNLNL